MINIDSKYLESVQKRMYSASYSRQFSEDVLYNGIKKGMIKTVQDNQQMFHILDDLYAKGVLIRGSFVDLVLRIILFHQAFYGLPHIPPFSELTIGKLHFEWDFLNIRSNYEIF